MIERQQRKERDHEKGPDHLGGNFECPTCHERFAQTEVFETEIHMGETYHCGECGGQVVFQALSIEE